MSSTLASSSRRWPSWPTSGMSTWRLYRRRCSGERSGVGSSQAPPASRHSLRWAFRLTTVRVAELVQRPRRSCRSDARQTVHEQRGVAIGNLGLDARGDIGQWDERRAGEWPSSHSTRSRTSITRYPASLSRLASSTPTSRKVGGCSVVIGLGLQWVGGTCSAQPAMRSTDPLLSTVKAIGTTAMPYLRARSGRSRTSITWTRRPASRSRLVSSRQSVHSGCVKATT